MILAAAVVVGLAAGMIRAWLGKRPYRIINLRFPGLVFFAFLPQFITFYSGRYGLNFSDEWVKVMLVGSQILLLVFAWLNRKHSSFWLLGAGLLLNFLVIIFNGGLMPISPETVRKLYPDVSESKWQVGKRLGNGKDIVLPVSAMRLWFLSDRFMLPDSLRTRIAFSAGDVLIALGAFWLLWTLGGPQSESS